MVVRRPTLLVQLVNGLLGRVRGREADESETRRLLAKLQGKRDVEADISTECRKSTRDRLTSRLRRERQTLGPFLQKHQRGGYRCRPSTLAPFTSRAYKTHPEAFVLGLDKRHTVVSLDLCVFFRHVVVVRCGFVWTEERRSVGRLTC